MDSPLEPDCPPTDVVTFLAHLQVSLEATYISATPTVPDNPHSARLSAPPRTSSAGRLKSRLNNAHPSIFPPHTPNPTPSTADNDRRYVRSEGTLLLASIWGQDASENSQEAFSLILSEADRVWVAVYRLAVNVCKQSSYHCNVF